MFVLQIRILLTGFMFCKFVYRIFVISGIFLYMVKELESKIVVRELNADCGYFIWAVCCLENYYKSAFNFP